MVFQWASPSLSKLLVVQISQIVLQCIDISFWTTRSFLKSDLCSRRKVSTQIHVFLIFFPVVFAPEEYFTHMHMLELLWGNNKASFQNFLRKYAAAAKSLQSSPTLCDPTDGSPPGSPIPGILQARTLEWVAISIFNAWKWKGKVKSLSRVWLFAAPWTAAYQAPPSMGFSRQEYWSGVPLPSPNKHLVNTCKKVPHQVQQNESAEY